MLLKYRRARDVPKKPGQKMAQKYTVGMSVNGKSDHVAIDAEDALIAALRVKSENPTATITYVRKRNARGDRRHPHQRVGSAAP